MRNDTHFFGGWIHQTIRVEGRINTIEMTAKIAAPRWLFIGSLLPKTVRRLDEITFEIGTPQKKTWYVTLGLTIDGHAIWIDLDILRSLKNWVIAVYVTMGFTKVYHDAWWFSQLRCAITPSSFFFCTAAHHRYPCVDFFFPLPCLISEYHQFKRSDFFRLNSCFRPVIKPGVWQNGRGIFQL